MSYSYSTLAFDSLQISQDLLSDFAKSNDFTSSIFSVFGNNLNPNKVEELKTQWSAADFNDLPAIAIEVRPANEMNGALGAYAAKTDTIYLSEAFLQQADKTAIAAVLLEEIGHGVDARLNAVDAPGDEGHIFSAVVRGETVSAEQMQELRAEDDTATLMLDGQAVDVEMASKQYSLSTSDTWEQAQTKAQTLGANLVTVNNGTEQQFLVNNFSGTEEFWIGLTDKDIKGTFKWANGELLSYTNWNSGEPNNANNNEDYVGMNFNSPGKWNDYNGVKTLRGIIEKDVSSGYLLSTSGTWEQTQTQAQNLGGNLVAIADAAEQQFLVNNFSGTEEFWIGLTDKDKEGTFKWVNPEPVGYTNWYPGEPNNGGGNENYVGMNFRSYGQWNDYNASQSLRGIIEIANNVTFLPSTNAGEPSTNGKFELSLSKALRL